MIRELLGCAVVYWITAGLISFGLGVAAASDEATNYGLAVAAVIFVGIVAARLISSR